MVIDSSAVIATLFAEPETDAFLEAMARPGRKYMSSVNILETMIVVEAKKGPKGSEALARFLATAGIEVLPFDSSQSEITMAAWRRFGRGRHPAGLNLGDCAAYALASTLNETLLFKGDDFSKTDAASAALSNGGGR